MKKGKENEQEGTKKQSEKKQIRKKEDKEKRSHITVEIKIRNQRKNEIERK